MMDEVWMMIQNMLDQQRREFRELLTQQLVNDRGGVPVINKPIIVNQVNNGPVPSHATTIQEGKNKPESYEGPKKPQVGRNDEPRGNYKFKDFTTCKSSSFSGKEDPVGVMDCIF